MNPFRFVRDFFSFIRWYRSMTKKDEHGRVSGFLYKADDPAKKDYLDNRHFGRRVFVSFARESLQLAEAFEDSLRAVGLDPWRYTPTDKQEHQQLLPPKASDTFVSQLKRFREENPGVVQELEATMRRCTAVLLLISDASLRSVICEVEAWIAGIIHGYGHERNAAVYVILERSGLSPPVFLSKFWSRVYEPGLEEALAVLIAEEIEAQEYKLKLIERHRSKIFR